MSLTVVNFKLDFSKFFWATFNNESTFPVFVYAKLVSLSINPISGTFLFFSSFEKQRIYDPDTREGLLLQHYVHTHLCRNGAIVFDDITRLMFYASIVCICIVQSTFKGIMYKTW